MKKIKLLNELDDIFCLAVHTNAVISVVFSFQLKDVYARMQKIAFIVQR